MTRAAAARTVPPRPPAAQLQHALLLIARIEGGAPHEAAAAREALARWRASDPTHEAAYATAAAAWGATRAEALRQSVPLPAGAQPPSRRKALQLLGASLVVGGAASLGWWQWRAPLQQLELATPAGQLRSAHLADGSTLVLDARTRADVVLYRDRREVWLREGGIRFAVAPEARRPFIVHTAFGRVTVLGTVFTVEARHGAMRVQVAEGRVQVWAAAGGPGVVLSAGQAVAAEAGAVGPLRRVAPADVGAWRDGWLVFDDTPLPEVVARWNDYLPRPLRLADAAALRRLRLTGSFPLRAPAAFLESLPGVLPVQVERGADGDVRIGPRQRP